MLSASAFGRTVSKVRREALSGCQISGFAWLGARTAVRILRGGRAVVGGRLGTKRRSSRREERKNAGQSPNIEECVIKELGYRLEIS